MLVGYSFNNFCSFDTDSEFSMEAGVGKVKGRFPDNYVALESEYDLLKTAVIVGENAGGKSNFINSLKFFRGLFNANALVQTVSVYVNASAQMRESNPVQKFNMSFASSNGQIYFYAIEIDSFGIVTEKLSKQSKRKQALSVVFNIIRNEEGVYEAKQGKGKDIVNILKNSNNSNGLFVSKLSLLGNQDAKATVDWFLKKLSPGAIATDEKEDAMKREDDLKVLRDPRYVEIFRMVDYSICDIEVDDVKPYSKSIIIRRDSAGNSFKQELSQDSAGVREFFAWAVQIFRIVYEDKIVFADEMDRVLNPILSDRVIAFINGMEHKGQFVFSTHNVLHLNLKTYMKEQIYFITKSKDELTSELYSLSDFPEVRYETTKIYEFYMKGILGGTSFE
ncbi:MAG: ATP-binding protein [Holdemanella sp.]|nr:ATP-binding protein [Holdemanella sp.]